MIGGKSMGGWIDSTVADDAGVAGLVCLGYPFHPVGKPERLRIEHLRDLKTPALIVQGERDPFGSKSDVAAYELPETVQVHWLPDGDLGFEPRKASGRTEGENREEGVKVVIDSKPGFDLNVGIAKIIESLVQDAREKARKETEYGRSHANHP